MISEPAKALRKRAEKAERERDEARAEIRSTALKVAAMMRLHGPMLEDEAVQLVDELLRKGAPASPPELCGCISPAGNICARPKGHLETHRSEFGRWWHR